jgi:hypothetical protein
MIGAIVDTTLTSDNLLERLTQEARRVARTTQHDGDRFDELHFIALDIHAWLRHISAEEKDQVRQSIATFIMSQSLPPLHPDDDQQVAQCLRLLIQMVYKQPQLL